MGSISLKPSCHINFPAMNSFGFSVMLFILLFYSFYESALYPEYRLIGTESNFLNKVNVFTPDVGGGFGMKIFNYPEYVLTLAAAKLTNKPIKWNAKRSESFLSDIHGRDHFSKAKLGFDKFNKITALKVETFANMGAYLSDYGVFIPTYAGNAMLTGS